MKTLGIYKVSPNWFYKAYGFETREELEQLFTKHLFDLYEDVYEEKDGHQYHYNGSIIRDVRMGAVCLDNIALCDDGECRTVIVNFDKNKIML